MHIRVRIKRGELGRERKTNLARDVRRQNLLSQLLLPLQPLGCLPGLRGGVSPSGALDRISQGRDHRVFALHLRGAEVRRRRNQPV